MRNLSIQPKLGFVNRPFCINFPNGSLEQGGTCEFMTEQCKKFCADVYISDLLEFNTYAFFNKSTANEICQELVTHKIESPLVWFAESGDCLTLMEKKVLEIMRFVSTMGIAQNGFTRNISFWFQSNKIDNVRIFLTVENMDSVQRMNKLGPISYPLYGTEQVRIYSKGAIWACGGGDLIPECGSGWVGMVGKEYPEDCTNCYKEKIGCFV